MINPILDKSNNDVAGATLRGTTLATGSILGGVPLGLAGNELAVKVINIVGGSEGGVTPNFIAATASSTTVIPIGAIGAGVLILTGTGTLNTIAWPTGTPWNEPNKLAATVTLVLGGASTAIIYYGV